MKIGVISDTHGVLPFPVFDLFKGCILILHAGDIGNYSIIDDLSTIARVIAVKGNSDNFSSTEYPMVQDFTLLGNRFFLTHDLNRAKPPTDANIIIHGHTHIPTCVKTGTDKMIVNPGSCGGTPRGEIKKHSVAVINLEKGNFFTDFSYIHI